MDNAFQSTPIADTEQTAKQPMVFDAGDHSGAAVSHTNALMCLAKEFVLIGLDMFTDPTRRAEIVARFESTGRTITGLSNDQIVRFAGIHVTAR